MGVRVWMSVLECVGMGMVVRKWVSMYEIVGVMGCMCVRDG